MRLETDRFGMPVLILGQERTWSLTEIGWAWSKANAVRFELEEILGEYVHITWDRR